MHAAELEVRRDRALTLGHMQNLHEGLLALTVALSLYNAALHAPYHSDRWCWRQQLLPLQVVQPA